MFRFRGLDLGVGWIWLALYIILEPSPQGTRSSEADERREEQKVDLPKVQLPDQHFACISASLPNFLVGL